MAVIEFVISCIADMGPADPKYRYLYLVWSVFEILCFGGLIFGRGLCGGSQR